VRQVTETQSENIRKEKTSNQRENADESINIGAPPDTIDSLLLKGLTAHNENRLDEAIAIYSRIVNLKPQDKIASIILVHRGMAFFSRGEYEHAAEDFSAALTLDSNNLKARYHRALVHRVGGRVKEALTDIDQCLAKDPYNIEFLLSRAEILFDAERYSDARKDCRIIMQLEPDFAPLQQLWNKLGGDEI
jgi:putative GTP pyrophosphokinase